MRCCFDASEYTGVPDHEPCPKAFDVPEIIRGLDALYAQNREAEAQEYLEGYLAAARKAGDWRAELSLVSELLGQYRRSMDEEKALAAVESALALIREHRLGRTVSGATVLLNAATTLGCFSRHEEALPIFRHVSRVYGEQLDPHDYRFAGLFNNMAQSHAALGEFAQAEAACLSAVGITDEARKEYGYQSTLTGIVEKPVLKGLLDRRLRAGMSEEAEYAFMASKCVPVFDRLGFFLYAKDLEERIRAIHERT